MTTESNLREVLTPDQFKRIHHVVNLERRVNPKTGKEFITWFDTEENIQKTGRVSKSYDPSDPMKAFAYINYTKDKDGNDLENPGPVWTLINRTEALETF